MSHEEVLEEMFYEINKRSKASKTFHKNFYDLMDVCMENKCKHLVFGKAEMGIGKENGVIGSER